MKETVEIREWIDGLNRDLENNTPEEVIAFFLDKYRGKIAFSSSLGAEDQVLTDMIVKIDPTTRIFTLDTGRLFPETYDVIEETNRKYDIRIEMLFPDYNSVEKMIREKGPNLFYENVENRKLCCHIRKIEPSKRAFRGLEAWISGLRKDQSVARFFTKLVEWDENNQVIKVNPLLKWREKDVWEYIRENDVPYNKLHDSGFPSIGCQPCTRAVKKGEDIRAGRWWWEEPEHSECGLHVKKK